MSGLWWATSDAERAAFMRWWEERPLLSGLDARARYGEALAQLEALQQKPNYGAAADPNPYEGRSMADLESVMSSDEYLRPDSTIKPEGGNPLVITDRDVRAEIERSIAPHAADYNVATLVDAFIARWGLVPIDTVPEFEYWDMVAAHDRTYGAGGSEHAQGCGPACARLHGVAHTHGPGQLQGSVSVIDAAEAAARMMGLSVLTAVDARTGISGGGRRLITIRLVDPSDDALKARAALDRLFVAPEKLCGPTTDGGWFCRPYDCGRPADCPLPDDQPEQPDGPDAHAASDPSS